MPITAEQFKKGLGPKEEAMLTFLKNRNEEAFAVDEISSEVIGKYAQIEAFTPLRGMSTREMQTLLNEMVLKGILTRRFVSDKLYYRIREETAPSMAKVPASG